MPCRPLARRPSSAVAAAALVLALVAGCDQVTGMIAPARPPAFQGQTAPAIQLGSGNTSAGPWTGWLYPTATGACTVVVASGRPGSPMCSSASGPFDGDIGVGYGGSDEGTTAVGSTPDQAAAVAEITLATGEVVRVPVIWPDDPVAKGNGYFMAQFDAGTEIDLIVVLDARGTTLDSYPFGR